MGNIKQYSCNCGYKMRFFSGAGMQAVNKSVAEKMFPEVFAKRKIEQVFLDHVLGDCMRCKALKTVPRVQYQEEGKQNKEVALKELCECGAVLFIHENEESVRCPKCDGIMECTLAGHWD